jgi:hypothetical protein
MKKKVFMTLTPGETKKRMDPRRGFLKFFFLGFKVFKGCPIKNFTPVN